MACAGGGDVLAAGEMTFVLEHGRPAVEDVSNQSTGYCPDPDPDPDSWPAVEAALDRAGIRHPGGFTQPVVFRRCPACRERNLVRDGDFTCALCGAALPEHWNLTAGDAAPTDPLPAPPGIPDPPGASGRTR